MNVLYVFADHEHEMNCSKWNCMTPAKAINKLEGHSASLIHVNEWVQGGENAQKLSSEADIIVVGSGAAASSAALFAYEKGAKVIMVEKRARPNGTTEKSGGVFWT